LALLIVDSDIKLTRQRVAEVIGSAIVAAFASVLALTQNPTHSPLIHGHIITVITAERLGKGSAIFRSPRRKVPISTLTIIPSSLCVKLTRGISAPTPPVVTPAPLVVPPTVARRTVAAVISEFAVAIVLALTDPPLTYIIINGHAQFVL